MSRVQKRWYAVRCCCSVRKILGFIRLEEGQNTYTIVDKRGWQHNIKLGWIADSIPSPLAIGPHIRQETSPMKIICETAVHSDDKGLDFWRRMPDFIEVK